MMYNFSVVPGVYSASKRIAVIQDLRAAIGMSLQETSDLLDELTKGREIVFDVAGELGMGIIDQLHRNGIRVDELPEKDTSAPKESSTRNGTMR
jgi:ribosomal protein L7/L12